MVRSRRGKMAQVGHLFADAVDQFKRQPDASLMGNSGQVQHRICGAAQRHVHPQSVLKRGGGQDIQGTDVIMKQLQHLHARLFCQPHALGIDRRDAAVAGQGNADGLAQAIHGVRREHARAGSAAGAGIVLDIPELSGVHAPRTDRADGFKNTAEIHRVPGSV
ncbi:hypothetical protein SDC9_189746 [bioreactor metagenome]|uniref:Uncharacterized protein n=1 Tax=bioreactor metagenome TaxID=1076179 RepID=A0A645HTK8_9ZZZZ